MNELSSTPHNDFFYEVMSKKDLAQAFFHKYLPQKLKKVVNLNKIDLCESKNVILEGKSLYKDMLYKCTGPQNQTAYLYALCEHQSHLEKHMPLRILEYNTRVIRTHIKQENSGYPLFANFVVYHGKAPWKYSTRLGDYYENKILGEQRLFMAPFTLINLSGEDEE
ncbi:MAG: Rpn family recombination-promoting nuclease/putative transposase [Bacteroidota bacterium]